MVVVFFTLKIRTSMTESGNKDFNMGKAFLNSVIRSLTLGTGMRAKDRDKGSMYGKMVSPIKESGPMIK